MKRLGLLCILLKTWILYVHFIGVVWLFYECFPKLRHCAPKISTRNDEANRRNPIQIYLSVILTMLSVCPPIRMKYMPSAMGLNSMQVCFPSIFPEETVSPNRLVIVKMEFVQKSSTTMLS